MGVAVAPGMGVEDISTGMLDTLPLSPLAFTVSGPDEVQGMAGAADEPWAMKLPYESAVVVSMSASVPPAPPLIAVTVTTSPAWNPEPHTTRVFLGVAHVIVCFRMPSWLRMISGFFGLASSPATMA